VPEPVLWKGGGSQPPVAPDPRPLITCMVFNTYGSSEGGCGWRKELFHEDMGLFIPIQDDTTAPEVEIRSVIYDIVGADEFECKSWDPGSLDSFKSMEFTSSSESIFCTYEDGMVSGKPKHPWLMCDEVARKWVQQSKLISAEHWQRKSAGFCWPSDVPT
jgi:hypothetical protein